MYTLESAASRALPSKVNLARTSPGLCWGLTLGVGGAPKVILFVLFVNWAKKIVTNGHTNGTMDGQT